MKFTVGYQILPHNEFIDKIIEYKNSISEVYFSWGDFPNGRNNQLARQDMLAWEAQNLQINQLKILSDADISLNLLLNANCYGKDSQSRAFFNKIGNTVDYIKNNFGLNSVTTTSPLIAKFIKTNFEDLGVRASVNMEIGTVQGMEYVSGYFDSYYMKREYNRDFEKISELKNWCDANGKKLFMLANSGCLNFCSAHNFHDNLVAHESEISQMDNAYEFTGICHDYLKNPDNYSTLADNLSFVRPEDIHKYDGYFEAAKLATRVHKNPVMVLESYAKQKYSGDTLRLLEPAHSIYPYVLENANPIKLVKLAEDIAFLGDTDAR